MRLAQILSTGEFGVLRAKGFVEDLSGDVHFVQIVGDRYDITRLTQSEELALVCIARLGCLKMGMIFLQFYQALQQQNLIWCINHFYYNTNEPFR